MKKLFILIGLLAIIFQLKAHDLRSITNNQVDCWKLKVRDIEGIFFKHEQDFIFIQDQQGLITKHPLQSFSPFDRGRLEARIRFIDEINRPGQQTGYAIIDLPEKLKFIIYLFMMAAATVLTYWMFSAKKGSLVFASFLCILILAGFKVKLFGPLTTDPLFIDAAFTPHKHRVNTRWDNTWFYVESRGIPDHIMMKGITKWQQQVPLPQCYTGTNSWQIPLNPEIAANPIPVNQMHFLRGAVAIASNGIPIFNPYTNTGIDALKDGQLDIFGGHSGRADDYHYHIAPLHLEDSIKNLPIAFSLDGFAIYGIAEPDGTPMKALDEFHGHFGKDGVYHYHGTKEAPYMIGIMKGKVTEDGDLQLIPQPRAKGVRPSLTPLTGATITDFSENSLGNGYILTYVRNGDTYKVDYSWTNTGRYTYIFSGPSGTTTEVYNGSAPCELPTWIEELEDWESSLKIYPNPASTILNISYNEPIPVAAVKEVSLLDMTGKKIFTIDHAVKSMDVANLARGIYLLQVKYNQIQLSKKVIIQ